MFFKKGKKADPYRHCAPLFQMVNPWAARARSAKLRSEAIQTKGLEKSGIAWIAAGRAEASLAMTGMDGIMTIGRI